MTHGQRHPEDDVPTQPDNDDRDPREYLGVVLRKQLLPNTGIDTDAPAGRGEDQSRVFLASVYTGPEEPKRVRLVAEHPDSTQSNLSPALTLREMDSFLRGAVMFARGTVARKTETIGTEGVDA